MITRVRFWSYFREKAGVAEIDVALTDNLPVGEAVNAILLQIPALSPFRSSMLVAVGCEYQTSEYCLQNGDELSLFPPVQGG